MNKKIIGFILGVMVVFASSSPAFCWMSSTCTCTIDVEVGTIGDCEVSVLADTFTEDYFISIDSSLSSELQAKATAATNELPAYMVLLESSIRDIHAFDSTFTEFSGEAYNKTMELKIYYVEQDLIGIIEDYLRGYVLNETTEEWEQLGATTDMDNKCVSFDVNHFSVFCLCGAAYDAKLCKITDASDNTITSIDFGDLEKDSAGTSILKISHLAGENISGTLSATKDWIKLSTSTFNAVSTTITVTTQSQWLPVYGENTGSITVTSSAGNQYPAVTVNHVKPWSIWSIFESMGCAPGEDNPDYQPNE